MLIDTHAHLNFPNYSDNIQSVIERSIDNEVTKIICASSNVDDSAKAVAVGKRYQRIVFPSVGIHPQKTDPQNKLSIESQINQLNNIVSSEKIIAIGECGLDYSPAPPGEEDRPRGTQIRLFQAQIKIAKKFNLPLIIHARESIDDTIKILTKFQPVNGVFHCYAGGKKRIEKIIEMGFYFGIDGNVTYDEGLQAVTAKIPLASIVLETDSPFLSPVPYRNSQNEPKNTRYVAEKVAKIKGVSFDKIAKATTSNAKKLFKI